MSFGDKELIVESKVTNEHYYRVDVFYTILDMQMQELNCRFPETSTELLLGVACLNPIDSFSNFDKDKILRMTRLYPDDFDELGIETLKVVNLILSLSMCMMMKDFLT